jgi:BMFP domain-containing protein YqiC
LVRVTLLCLRDPSTVLASSGEAARDDRKRARGFKKEAEEPFDRLLEKGFNRLEIWIAFR